MYPGVPVNVTVVDPSFEGDSGRFEGVLCSKVNVEDEDPSLVNGTRGSQDCAVPLEQVVSLRYSEVRKFMG